MPDKPPLHHRVRHHIVRHAKACDQWCRDVRMYDRTLPLSFLGGVLLFLVYFVTLAAPLDFPSASLVKVPQGASVKDVASILKEKNIIRSTLVFEGMSRILGSDQKLIAGEYFFPGSESVITVAERIAEGDHELVPIRVTIADGASNKQISDLLTKKIPDFDADGFARAVNGKEGMLYPDTYFFMPGEDSDLIASAMLNNFKTQVESSSTMASIEKFGKPLTDVLTMASLLEKEASDTKSREMIAGILWKRIELGMALQVDAVFPYIIGVNSLQLTKTQLQTDSPYNTYTHKGLPPGPIANPSLDSILAAVMPTKSNYLYYLSDLQGNLHYCATYPCQQANAAKYLGS